MGHHIKETAPMPSEQPCAIDKPTVRIVPTLWEGPGFDPAPTPTPRPTAPQSPVIFTDWACI